MNVNPKEWRKSQSTQQTIHIDIRKELTALNEYPHLDASMTTRLHPNNDASNALNKPPAPHIPPLDRNHGGGESTRFEPRVKPYLSEIPHHSKRAPTDSAVNSYLKLYRSLGLAVVPAVYGGKRPIVEWKRYQREAPSDRQVEAWFNDGRRHNVAVICGPASGNLTVLDFDDLKLYGQFFTRKVEEATLVVETGSGKRHVYFRTLEPVESFRLPELKLEVRSTGNVVIAPPSLHPSGKHYRFVNSYVHGILTVRGMRESILKRAKELGVETHVPPAASPTRRLNLKTPVVRFVKEPPCIRRIRSGVEEGLRNEAAVRMASLWLNSNGASPEDTLARLVKWNRLNRPPLPMRELQAVLRSVSARGYIYGCAGLSIFCSVEERGKCPVHKRAERMFKRKVNEL